MKLQQTSEGVILYVHIKPNSKEFQLKLSEDMLIVSCREAPVKGKVNKELLKQLSRIFSRKVELLSGFTSRQKKLLVSGITEEEVNKILAYKSKTK
jgi:hypothetical protein